jgi:hypothetical protein
MISLLATLATLLSAGADTLGAPQDSIVPSKTAFAATPVATQAPSSFERFGRWQFGVAGGQSTGGGLALRYWFDERNGIEVHGYAYLSKRSMPDNGSSFFSTYGDDGYDYSGDTGTVATGELNLGAQYLREVLKIHLFNANGLIKGPCHLRGLTFVGLGGFVSYEDRDLQNSTPKWRYSMNGQSEYAVTPESKLKYHSTTKKVLGGTGVGLEVELSRFSAHLMVGLGGYSQVPADSYEFGPTVDGGVFVRF